MKTKFNLLIAFITLFAMSCNDKKDVVKGDYQSGVLVVNAGDFSAGNGDVTYYNPSTSKAEDNIFHTVNGDFVDGDLQSVTIDGDNGYLVGSEGNKIIINNINTFQSTSTFNDALLINPRYAAVINNKGYVSTWGDYDANYNLTKSYILTFDTKTLELVDTIGTDVGAENVLYNGKYLFVATNNFSGTNTISVINPATDKRINKIALSSSPASLVIDANSKLWAITYGTGSYDANYNYVGNNDGALYRINPSTFAIEQTINLNANPNGNLVTSSDKKTLFYVVGNSVYKIGISETSAPANAFISNSDFVSVSCIGVNNSDDIYIGDAISYSSPGTAYIYDANGSAKSSFTTGIDPLQFIFR